MKNKIISILRSENDYISGERISKKLGISRTAVWKHIKNLKNNGYEIISFTKKGYKLISEPDNISPNKIKAYLNTSFVAQNIIYNDEVLSTNDEAKKNADMPDGSLFIADVQTAGKGRLGRSWVSPRGTGIWMSLLLKPDIPLSDISQLTLIAGIAVSRAIGDSTMIKWPNDIVIGTKKVCGILTEMSAETDKINYVVCGIGINVNTHDFPAELMDKASSILIETEQNTDRCYLIARVMNEFEPLYKKFITDGFSPFRDDYKKSCITLGRDIKVSYHGKELIGNAVDIDNNGGLIIDTGSKKVTVTSGEVSVRGIYGYI